MNLSISQKNELNRLYNRSNDSFFSFLDSYDYEKKHNKLSSAKASYANYVYEEEVLYLLDDTFFGSADQGMVITNKAIYIKIAFEDKLIFKINSIVECSYVDKQTISINYNDIKMVYLENSEYEVLNILKKLIEFYKQNIIKEKNLDVYSTITIPYNLAKNGGKFKDNVSGYDITIPKGTKDGTVWSWNGYGKSHDNIKGKLTITVKVEPETIKSQPQFKSKQKTTIQKKPVQNKAQKNIYVNCINCSKENINPTSYNCSFCGKSLTTKEKRIEKEAKKEELSLNDIIVDNNGLDLIVTCVNCDRVILNYLSSICPHCCEDANEKLQYIEKDLGHLEFKNILNKIIEKKNEEVIKSSNFEIKITDMLFVKDLQNEFNRYTGLFLRVYDGKSQARTNKKVVNLDVKEVTITITTRMKIDTIESMFKDIGLKVQIASSDNKKLCANDLSLARAKEKYKE